jgi:hypothetical protein
MSGEFSPDELALPRHTRTYGQFSPTELAELNSLLKELNSKNRFF